MLALVCLSQLVVAQLGPVPQLLAQPVSSAAKWQPQGHSCLQLG